MSSESGFNYNLTREYLTALYGKADCGHIVFIEPSRNRVSAAFTVNQIDAAVDHVRTKGHELFLKINVMDYDAIKQRSAFAIGGKDEVQAIVSIHLDVDAGKDDRYLTPQKMLEVIYAMPLAPSAIIRTNGAGGGYHVYWMLDEPHYISDEADRSRCQAISTRWLEELRKHANPGNIDGTADICRYLRPVGSIRKSGNYVQPYIWEPTRRYRFEQFDLPEIEKPAPLYCNSNRCSNDESIIEQYLAAVGLNSVAAILLSQGYSNTRGDFWTRPGSQSGAPTGEVYRVEGREGFTVKSGAADPLSCMNDRGGVGRWYSIPALWVAFEHAGDWKQAAKFCHEFFEQQKPKVNIEAVLKSADNSKSEPEPEQQESVDSTESTKQEAPPATLPAGRILVDYLKKLRSGKLPQLLPQRAALEGIEVGQELVTIIGAPPGKGKTALAMQIMYDALELDETLVATVANAETSFEGLLRREFARLTRVKSDNIRFGKFEPGELESITEASTRLLQRLERVSVLNDPHNLMQLMRLRDAPPGLLIVDYLQKFAPRDKDVRVGVNEVMDGMRILAKNHGWAVICLSSTARTKDGKHADKELTMSSYKESGEIEFNADSCYLLIDEGPVGEVDYIRNMLLKHVKNRHGAKRDVQLEFHMPRMEFSKPEPIGHPEFNDWSTDADNDPFAMEDQF